MFLETGRIHAADFIFPLLIITAPSCRGVFLKNIFSISLALISALTFSPVEVYSTSGFCCVSTISAPVFVFAIFLHASAICVALFSLSVCCRLLCMFRWILSMLNCEPSLIRKLRISSWKSTMSAIAPTEMIRSNMAPVSSSANAYETINQTMTNASMPQNMLMAPERRSSR